MKRASHCILWFVTGFGLWSSASAQWDFEGEPSLVEITENVFRTQHAPGAANSVVIATEEGLVVVDGTCRGSGTPEWLKGELSQRFDVPVKYVVLSHDHEDHICGLHVFDDTAVTVSHTNAREAYSRAANAALHAAEHKAVQWQHGVPIQQTE